MDKGTTFCPIIHAEYGHHLLHGELVPNEDVPILAVGRVSVASHLRRLKSHDLNTKNHVGTTSIFPHHPVHCQDTNFRNLSIQYCTEVRVTVNKLQYCYQ
jgi:hypothetical protein